MADAGMGSAGGAGKRAVCAVLGLAAVCALAGAAGSAPAWAVDAQNAEQGASGAEAVQDAGARSFQGPTTGPLVRIGNLVTTGDNDVLEDVLEHISPTTGGRAAPHQMYDRSRAGSTGE